MTDRPLNPSMGPRSDNRGYVSIVLPTREGLFPSMGPRSDNRGYAPLPQPQQTLEESLQWVHGPITVVM